MIIIFWVLEVFLFLMALVCIKAIFYPEAHARWTLERTKSQLKFYGFEGDINITAKSVAMMKNGHTILLVIIILLMSSLNIFIK